MSSPVTKPRPSPAGKAPAKVRVGNKVGILWAGKGLVAQVVEDRGNLGANGERVLRLDIEEGSAANERMQLEVPVQWLASMVRVQGVFLKTEAGHLEDISNEVVAFATQTKATEPWSLEIHFGLNGHREGFVGHRYSVAVPADCAEFTPKASVESGYQLGGTLRLTNGRVVIDDPVSRPKPAGVRIKFERT
ncbi:MAG: hypothetical protein IT380_10045 [Myxococcales bacterium]|nr:hypothetical protein [Myxococcales bacterium]